jgi:hypothetical protein
MIRPIGLTFVLSIALAPAAALSQISGGDVGIGVTAAPPWPPNVDGGIPPAATFAQPTFSQIPHRRAHPRAISRNMNGCVSAAWWDRANSCPEAGRNRE